MQASNKKKGVGVEEGGESMISIVVCSRDKRLLDELSENIKNSIGCDFEFIGIDNSLRRGITKVYNEGLKKAKFPYICFIHEDVRFLTDSWGKILIEKLKDKEIGVLGVAGSSFIPENGIWYSVKRPFVKGQVVHEAKGKEQLDRFGITREDEEVVVLDGLFLACRREVATEIGFDEELEGFHFYDADFSLRVSKKYKNIVTYDLLLKHYSGGKKDESYEKLRKKFIEKHKLPYSKLKTIPKNSFKWQTFEFDSKRKYPKILVGCPTSKDYEYCLEEYLLGLFSLNYPNYDILIVDNSEDDEFFDKLKSYGLKVAKGGFHNPVIKRIVESRNALRNYVLEEGYDYFFSLEQDVIPPRDVINMLLSAQQKIVSGLYFGFTNAYEFDGKDGLSTQPVRADSEDVYFSNSLKLMPVAYSLFNDKQKEMPSKKQKLRRLNEFDVNPPRKILVRMTGLGCILIHKTVLEKTKFRYEEGRKNADDRYFSDDVYDLGMPMILDTRIRCKHLVLKKKVKWV